MKYYFQAQYHQRLDLFDNVFVSMATGNVVEPSLPLEIIIESEDCVLYESDNGSIIDFSPTTLGYYWITGQTCLRTRDGLVFEPCDDKDAVQYTYIDGQIYGQKINTDLSQMPTTKKRYHFRKLNGCKAQLKQNDDSSFTLEIDEKEYPIALHELEFSFFVNEETGFTQDGEKLYYYDRPLPQLTLVDFRVLHFNYAKDNHVVVCGADVISQADAATFEVITTTLAKDKNHVYEFSKIIKGADAKSFVVIDGKEQDAYQQYSKDKQTVYYFGEAIIGADLASFRIIHGRYSADKNWVYRSGLRIALFDAESFYYISQSFVGDKNGIYTDFLNITQIAQCDDVFVDYDNDYFAVNDTLYWADKEHPFDADLASFSSINCTWAKDETHIYYKDEVVYKGGYETAEIFDELLLRVDDKIISNRGIIAGANAKEWHLLIFPFYACADRLFYQQELLDKGDPNTFEALDDNRFKDKSNVYIFDNDFEIVDTIFDINTENIVLIDECFLKTPDTVYFQELAIQDADPDTFEVLEYGFSRDKKAVFCNQEKLPELNPLDVTILNHNFIHDNNTLYYQSTRLDIEVSNMKILNDDIVKDNRHVYYKTHYLSGAEASSYQLSTRFFQRDNQGIYHNQHRLPLNADETVFLDEVYAIDNLRVFFIDSEIMDADVSSFKVIGNNVSVDKNNVYFREKRVEHADPASFKIMGYAQFVDDNHQFTIRNGHIVCL